MESKQKKRHSANDRGRRSTTAAHQEQDTGELAPGITIVRGSTPRPISLGSMPFALPKQVSSQGQQGDETPLPDFPIRAPSAPPVPEELDDAEEDTNEEEAKPAYPANWVASEESQEFDWLFEYGLEMDSGVLNSPEQLDGAALFYGPAVLKGYSILFGTVESLSEKGKGKRTIATVVTYLRARQRMT